MGGTVVVVMGRETRLDVSQGLEDLMEVCGNGDEPKKEGELVVVLAWPWLILPKAKARPPARTGTWLHLRIDDVELGDATKDPKRQEAGRGRSIR